MLDGLAVDTDLRWALLRHLVSRGGAVARRRSTPSSPPTRPTRAIGRRRRAGRPWPSITGKRETWETLTDGKLTIAMFRATLAGFADPDQSGLVEPYRPEYFAAVGEVWREWSSSIAQDFVEGGYSVCAIDQATIEATDAYLASVPRAARRALRLLNEGKDEVAPRAPQPGPRPRGSVSGALAEAALWRFRRHTTDGNFIALANRC